MAAPQTASSSAAVPPLLKAAPTAAPPTSSHSNATRLPAIDASPPRYTGSRDKLDRSLFKRTIPLLAARVPASRTGAVLRAPELRGVVAEIPRRRSVVHAPRKDGDMPDMDDKGDRLVLLRGNTVHDLPDIARDLLKRMNATLETYNLQLGYDYWNAPEILYAIFPPDAGFDEVPSSFAITGHIAHLNLIDEYLPYKYLIGEVILDKNHSIRTVVNKLSTIHAQFRFFDMELLAGDPDFEVAHHEAGCVFRFDFRKVYWNSRLHTEHERLVSLFHPTALIADVFAGVGPFAIPAAKKGCAVLANDLNPESWRWLAGNVGGNGVTPLVRPSCEDGRAFIRNAVRRAREDPFPGYAPPVSRSRAKAERRRRGEGGATKELGSKATGNAPKSTAGEGATATSSAAPEASPPTEPTPRSHIDHFVMNLPESAIEFLDAFRGLYADDPRYNVDGPEGTHGGKPDVLPMPMIHVHCFTREPEEGAREDIMQRATVRLGTRPPADTTLHLVRSVAPNKDMYCLSFRLPREVGVGRV
ncbi:Met-10+ like-protein-domain-containing protein [Schizophyllum commune]